MAAGQAFDQALNEVVRGYDGGRVSRADIIAALEAKAAALRDEDEKEPEPGTEPA
jgi:hypothetical protein